MNRRDLLFSTFPFGGALLLEQFRPILLAQHDAVDDSFDPETYEFWTRQIGAPSNGFAQRGRFTSSRGSPIQSEAEFLFYSVETGFVRAMSTETDTPVTAKLLDKGDVALVLSLDTIRPSKEHLQKVLTQKNGSLRIDLKQGFPLQQLSETLNWSAIASLFPSEDQFSGYHDFYFDPKSTWGEAKAIPLPGGAGFWNWNFSTQLKPSLWTQVMGFMSGLDASGLMGSSKENPTPDSSTIVAGKRKGGKATVVRKLGGTILGIGMPSIAKTAWDAFNQLFGSMQARGGSKTQWILHTADTPLVATKDARQRHPGRAVALPQGSYVVVESDKAKKLLDGGYQLKNGVIVPTETKDSDLEELTKSSLPDTSYISLSAAIQSINSCASV